MFEDKDDLGLVLLRLQLRSLFRAQQIVRSAQTDLLPVLSFARFPDFMGLVSVRLRELTGFKVVHTRKNHEPEYYTIPPPGCFTILPAARPATRSYNTTCGP